MRWVKVGEYYRLEVFNTDFGKWLPVTDEYHQEILMMGLEPTPSSVTGG
jgi:hypothetical protein